MVQSFKCLILNAPISSIGMTIHISEGKHYRIGPCVGPSNNWFVIDPEE